MQYYEAELVLKSFKPLALEKGMLFINKFGYNTSKEEVEVYELAAVPLDEEEYIAKNGYPVELYIIDPHCPFNDEQCVLATPDQIGWWDDGEDVDDLFTITTKQINRILNDFDGIVEIEVEYTVLQDEEGNEEEVIIPSIYEDFVSLRYQTEEYEEYEETINQIKEDEED